MTTEKMDMASIVIRNLDPALKETLRARATRHDLSMEAEARRLLQSALTGSDRGDERNLYERIRARVEPLGGIELELAPRELAPAPPRFE